MKNKSRQIITTIIAIIVVAGSCVYSVTARDYRRMPEYTCTIEFDDKEMEETIRFDEVGKVTLSLHEDDYVVAMNYSFYNNYLCMLSNHYRAGSSEMYYVCFSGIRYMGEMVVSEDKNTITFYTKTGETRVFTTNK